MYCCRRTNTSVGADYRYHRYKPVNISAIAAQGDATSIDLRPATEDGLTACGSRSGTKASLTAKGRWRVLTDSGFDMLIGGAGNEPDQRQETQ
jgi:hypothetical protein